MVQAGSERPRETQPGAGAPPIEMAPDLSWMDKTTGWGIRARPDFVRGGGLTINALNVGVYAEIPDRIQYRNRWPRGAYPSPVAGSIGGYYLQEKHEQWADCAGDVYEEGISRRWSTATDIPWDTAHGLPDDVELAICQLATELSQQGSVEAEVVSGWLQNLSPGYHEVKLYLATCVFDAARMFEGYRKRAMINGGGMMLESPGRMNRQIMETFSGWSQTVLSLWFVRGALQLTILRYLAAYGPTQADRELAARIIPDRMRATAYALDHIRQALAAKPDQKAAFSIWLTNVEAAQARDAADPVLWEALAIVFGGGVKGMDRGMEVVRRLQRDWMRAYVQRAKAAGLERGDQLIRPFRELLQPPGHTTAA
ncbi:MAG: hypothetical protein FJZ92_02610 [Chloroflexi bacterium]|nr:hypothetical protein [Chloroflexota bacterium]